MYTIFLLILMWDARARLKAYKNQAFIALESVETSSNASICLTDSRKIEIFQDPAATMSELRKWALKVEEPPCTADINKYSVSILTPNDSFSLF